MASISEPVEYDFPRQSMREEIANSITHGVGLFLSIAGAAVLLIAAYRNSDAWRVAGFSIYAASLIAVYASSTLSHAIQAARWKQLFRILDQAAIYLLIAGTYTPCILIYAPPGRRLPVLCIVWGVAFVGVASKLLLKHRVNSVDVINYALLGWLPAMALYGLVPSECLWWIFLGGVSYTVGTVFLSLDQRVPFFHAAWHAFVLAGSGFHYFAIMHYMLRSGSAAA